MLESFTYFREREFWKVIGMLDWQFVGDDIKVLERAKFYLAKKSNIAIESFRNTLNEKLINLEDTEFLNMMLSNSLNSSKQNITSRHFLNTRCLVVATGQKYYKSVLSNPAKMKENMEFGCLLDLSDMALQIKYGGNYQKINHGRNLKYELSTR